MTEKDLIEAEARYWSTNIDPIISDVPNYTRQTNLLLAEIASHLHALVCLTLSGQIEKEKTE